MYEKVEKQFEHAKGMSDDICKFNSLWISFNCFYNLKFEFKFKRDRDYIEEIKNNIDIKKVFLELNDEEKNDFYKFINERNNNGVRDLNNDNIVIYLNKNSFSEFLEIIYTIRNNQFHWWKDWESEDDIYLLIEANIVFELFLKKLYEKHWVI